MAMRALLLGFTALMLSACPLDVSQPFDAGLFELPDAGGEYDDAGCGKTFRPTADERLEFDLGFVSQSRTTCLNAGDEFTLSFPPRSLVQLAVRGRDGRPSFAVTRGGEVLHTGRPGASQTLNGWLFSGTQPVTLSMRVDADAGHAGEAEVAYSYTSFDLAGVRGVETSDGGALEVVAPSETPGTAPLLATTYFQFPLAESGLRWADARGCAPPSSNRLSYVSFVVDAGQWSVADITVPVFPDYDAVVLASDGGTLVSGVLGARLAFTLDARQTVTFGWAPLDGGPNASCSFDGGPVPDVFSSTRVVSVQ